MTYSISASELGVMLGVNPYKSKLELWLEKHGDLPRIETDSQPARWGNILEAPIADYYEEVTGRTLRRQNIQLRHKTVPFTGHIDRQVAKEKRGVEIKTVSLRVAHHWGKEEDQIAEYYLPQVHGYMLLKNYPVWDVAALVGGNEFRLYTIERDKEMDELILENVMEFIHSLDNDQQPLPDYVHQSTPELMKRLYPGTSGEVVELPEEVQYWHDTMKEAQAEINSLKSAVRSAKSRIQEAMGEASMGVFAAGGGYTRKVISRKGYIVEPTDYIDLRFNSRLKEG